MSSPAALGCTPFAGKVPEKGSITFEGCDSPLVAIADVDGFGAQCDTAGGLDQVITFGILAAEDEEQFTGGGGEGDALLRLSGKEVALFINGNRLDLLEGKRCHQFDLTQGKRLRYENQREEKCQE
ncbi:MAG: hypothetical protein C0621_00040 [Desulfuromonas sp.]|nr:MAG: hypothetical protein C0621_00040 [Desulfuromonas sp.]